MVKEEEEVHALLSKPTIVFEVLEKAPIPLAAADDGAAEDDER